MWSTGDPQAKTLGVSTKQASKQRRFPSMPVLYHPPPIGTSRNLPMMPRALGVGLSKKPQLKRVNDATSSWSEK